MDTKLLSLHYNGDNSYLFINRNEIFKFKADNKNANFPTQFCLGSISNGFSALESRKVSLNGNVYEVFSRLQFCWYIWHTKHSQIFNDRE